MRRTLAIAALPLLATAGLASCCSFPVGTLSPNQPCPATVTGCHVVNCLVTPDYPACPSTTTEPTTTTDPGVKFGVT